VHELAFQGNVSAGILNVVDQYGSYNTGAAPILKNGKVIGIISTDIEDKLIRESDRAARTNTIFLVVAIFMTMCVTMIILLLLMRNIRKMQDRLFINANYDMITGLPNRQHLMSYLDSICSKSSKQVTAFAMLFIDIDNFKMVNDGDGHDAGDELLRNIAEYLSRIGENAKLFRPPSGVLNVSARLGGDEFIKIIPNINTEAEAEAAAKRILENFDTPGLKRCIEKYNVGMSIGAALYPLHSDNYHVLVKYADIAMYQAKKSGKHTYRVFNFDMASNRDK
jgi:diguanylate cyclase (GGDEF)-like protein